MRILLFNLGSIANRINAWGTEGFRSIFEQDVILWGPIPDGQFIFDDKEIPIISFFKEISIKDIFKRLELYGPQAPVRDDAYLGAWDVEVLYLAKKLGYRVREVPVIWTYVKTTRLNPIQDSIKMALDVLKIRINDIKGVYKVD